jgi:hypothetical protein
MEWHEAYRRLKQLPIGTPIPKPVSGRVYRIEGWFVVDDGTEKLRYIVAEKSLPVWWIRESFERLAGAGALRTRWSRDRFYNGSDLGGCDFTTVGGLLTLIGDARYSGRGLFVRRERRSTVMTV